MFGFVRHDRTIKLLTYYWRGRAKCQKQKLPKYYFEHFRSSEQHADGANYQATATRKTSY